MLTVYQFYYEVFFSVSVNNSSISGVASIEILQENADAQYFGSSRCIEEVIF